MDLIEVKILNTAIERILNQTLARLGITYTQSSVIGYVKHRPNQEICQKDVEKGLGLTHPTVSSVLKRLEEKQFIITEPSSFDRRFKRIILTQKSYELSESIDETIEKLNRDAFQNFSDEEAAMFEKLIRKMTLNLTS